MMMAELPAVPLLIGSRLRARVRMRHSDGHDQIMIEFCSIIICSISLDHRGPSIRS